MKLKNVELVQGKCALCGGPIDKEWAGENPSLGTKCRQCWSKGEVFGPANVKINVQKCVVFDPLFGVHNYRFDWEGTKVMVNGKIGAICGDSYANGSYVKFPDDKKDGLLSGTFIDGLGYQELLRIYKEQGGDITPPPLNLPSHTPQKADLLDEPILPVTVEFDEKKKGVIRSIRVGRDKRILVRFGEGPEMPVLRMFHAFTNLYVRYKFGLMPNFAFEGGFLGRNFEVRNAMFGPVSISVRMHYLENEVKYIRDFEGLFQFSAKLTLLDMIYQQEQGRSEVAEKDADVYTVLRTWAFVMTTLLRYDWSKEKQKTLEDSWRCYCRMQDVLLNIMSLEELQAVLEYVKKGKMVHAGNSY